MGKKRVRLIFAYKCKHCNHEWRLKQGDPNNRAECPKCGNAYYEWVNYEGLKLRKVWRF